MLASFLERLKRKKASKNLYKQLLHAYFLKFCNANAFSQNFFFPLSSFLECAVCNKIVKLGLTQTRISTGFLKMCLFSVL